MTDTKSNIIDTIKALRTKAGNIGATEAEAMAAARMAAKLISKHDITEEDLQKAADDDAIKADCAAKKTKSEDEAVLEAVCGIEGIAEVICIIREGSWSGVNCVFNGLEADVEFALYLVEIIRSASRREWAKYAKTQYYFTKKERNIARMSFKIGLGGRVALNLIDMAHKRAEGRRQRAESDQAGTSLVVKKFEVIAASLKAKGTDIGSLGRFTQNITTPDRHAMLSGEVSGNNMNLGRPIEGVDNADELVEVSP